MSADHLHVTQLLVACVHGCLLWLMCYSDIALASESCLVPFGNDYVIFYVRCPDYCCKYRNGSQYCCSDCNMGVNTDSCMPEQLWRFILYVGLGIAGAVALCYLAAYVIKNYKESMKRACCKQRPNRVQDPSISMTATSAWHPGLTGNHRRSLQAGATDGEFYYDGASESDCARQLPYPQPPAYTAPAVSAGDQLELRGRELHSSTPPPVYYSAETDASGAATGAALSAQPADDEPPPAYTEASATVEHGEQQLQQ